MKMRFCQQDAKLYHDKFMKVPEKYQFLFHFISIPIMDGRVGEEAVLFSMPSHFPAISVFGRTASKESSTLKFSSYIHYLL